MISQDQWAALEDLQRAIGHFFHDINYLLAALRHRSFINQARDTDNSGRRLDDNQRLEFLGDAVLSLAISTLLYQTFPDLQEGQLSKMRAGLVNEVQLSDIARDISIAPCLFLGRGEEATGGREKNSILADALEAVLAAIYLDEGFAKALKVVDARWGSLIARSSRDDLLKDFKTRIQEYTQRAFSLTPEYRLNGSSGPDHARVFEVSLILAGQKISDGRGRSKKEAEQNAAQNALKTIEGLKFPAS